MLNNQNQILLSKDNNLQKFVDSEVENNHLTNTIIDTNKPFLTQSARIHANNDIDKLIQFENNLTKKYNNFSSDLYQDQTCDLQVQRKLSSDLSSSQFQDYIQPSFLIDETHSTSLDFDDKISSTGIKIFFVKNIF